MLTRACGLTVLLGSDCLKLIDFGGASIDGGEHGSCHQWYNYRRSTPEVSKQTDIFAFGCVIYEMIALFIRITVERKPFLASGLS